MHFIIDFVKSKGKLIELVVFWFLLILNLFVVFGTKYFPTFDGGAHSHNATIINDLLFDKNSIYHKYYILNPEIVPNWMSYFVLLVLKPLVPFQIAEKLLLLLHFVFTPMLFRQIIKKFANSNLILSYIVFPFVHFSLMYMGFFNFTLAIPLFFLFILTYLDISDQFKVKYVFTLFIILSLIYFSHIFVFIVTVIFILIHTGMYLIINYARLKEQKQVVKWIVARFFNLFIPSCLFLFFTISYFVKRPTEGKLKFLNANELNSIIVNASPLEAFGAGERPFTTAIFCLIFAMIIFTIARRIYSFGNKSMTLLFFKPNDVFLVMAIVFLIFTFTQPNEDGYGGFISIRMVLFMFFFFMLWIATHNIGKSLGMILIVPYLFFSYQLLGIKKSSMVFLNSQIKKLEPAMKLIEPNSTLVTAFFADHYFWSGIHYTEYLAGNKPVVILNNYEASSGYFPVLWKELQLPKINVGDLSSEQACFTWKSRSESKDVIKADYVLLFGEQPDNECYVNTLRVVEESYILVSKEKDISLFRLRR